MPLDVNNLAETIIATKVSDWFGSNIILPYSELAKEILDVFEDNNLTIVLKENNVCGCEHGN